MTLISTETEENSKVLVASFKNANKFLEQLDLILELYVTSGNCWLMVQNAT